MLEESKSSSQKKEQVNISNEQVGAGAYGSIFKCKYRDKTYAMKIIRINPESKQGIPNIMETSIMASISHPYINNSLRTSCESGYLYIMQELASSDLCKETRGKGLLKTHKEKLRLWCLMLAQAVHCLHIEGIIHCDIKASNVLLFGEQIKLCDFSLAVKCWGPQVGKEFSHSAGTNTHRAPECFTGCWGKEVDIWALACTFYELAYGALLFPTQSKDVEGKDKEARRRNAAKYINCLHDFLRGPGLLPPHEESKDYIKAFFPSPEDEEEKLFLSLLSIMLTERNKRADISTVLGHPYFKERHKVIHYAVRTDNDTILSNEEKRRVERYISRHVGGNTFSNHEEGITITNAALQLYTKCARLNIHEATKAAACVLIADKLINYSEAIKIDVPLCYLLKAERDICEHLGFRLHSNIDPKERS